MPKKKIGYILISCAVSVILIWILLRQIEIKDFIQTFTRIFIPALLAFMFFSFAAAALRSWRYKLLLKPQRISWGNIFLVTFIRNLFVDLLPARIGSLSYVYILNKRLNFSFNTAASSFVVAFVYDFLSLSPFLVLSILAVGIGGTSLSTPLMLLISVFFFLIVLAVFWKLPELLRLLLRIYLLAIKGLKAEQKKWAVVSVEKIQLTIEDIIQIRKRGTDLPVFILSLGIRLAKYGSLYFLLFALLRSHGYAITSLSFWKTILGVTGAEMTGFLPIKGIGGFGTWESGWAGTLMLLGFGKQIAIISSGIHLVTNLFEYVLGLTSILILALPFSRKKLPRSSHN